MVLCDRCPAQGELPAGPPGCCSGAGRAGTCVAGGRHRDSRKHIFLLVLDGVVVPAAADLALLVRVGAEVLVAAGDPRAAFLRVEV